MGKPEVVRLALVALLCEGHILLEDVPGLGKTTLAKAIARSLGCNFKRIQFTPDLMPSDITGINYYNQKIGEFVFREGPLIAQVVLADEVNRATPRTQAALLEAMEEQQLTVEGTTTKLPRPFLVMATQNPVELEGTFPLPEAQLDRFLVRLKLGYPSEEDEDEILRRFEGNSPLESLEPVITGEELIRLAEALRHLHVEPAVRRYAVRIVQATREDPAFELGHPRGSLALFRTARAWRRVSVGLRSAGRCEGEAPYVLPIALILSTRAAARAQRRMTCSRKCCSACLCRARDSDALRDAWIVSASMLVSWASAPRNRPLDDWGRRSCSAPRALLEQASLRPGDAHASGVRDAGIHRRRDWRRYRVD